MFYTVPVIKLRTIDGREIVRKLPDASKSPEQWEGPFRDELRNRRSGLFVIPVDIGNGATLLRSISLGRRHVKSL